MRKVTPVICLIIFLTGCGSLPNLKVGYFLPKSSLEVTVTQTGACTKGNLPLLTTDVATSLSYSRDDSRFVEVQLEELDGFFSKGDATFSFYGDGRLRSVNSKQTGQTTDGLKAFLKMGALQGIFAYQQSKIDSACKFLEELTKDPKKGLTIIHRGYTNFPKSGADIKIDLQQMSVNDYSYSKLTPVFGTVGAVYSVIDPDISHTDGSKTVSKLRLVEPAVAKIKITITRAGKTSTTESSAWVPQYGKPYDLPIQKAPLFGENIFEVDVSESGRVTKLRYSGDTGASGVLGIATEAEAAFKSETTKDKVERIKAEADLIVQQQRLIQCLADPSNCPK